MRWLPPLVQNCRWWSTSGLGLRKVQPLLHQPEWALYLRKALDIENPCSRLYLDEYLIILDDWWWITKKDMNFFTWVMDSNSRTGLLSTMWVPATSAIVSSLKSSKSEQNRVFQTLNLPTDAIYTLAQSWNLIFWKIRVWMSQYNINTLAQSYCLSKRMLVSCLHIPNCSSSPASHTRTRSSEMNVAPDLNNHL